MNDWQPIETAPRDGSSVIVFGPAMNKPTLGHWDAERYSRNPKPHWEWAPYFGVRWNRDNQPTHWMPLPEPPR